MIRIVIAGSLLLASIYAAHAINFGRQGVVFGKLGAMPGAGVPGPPPPACSNELDFTDACNSQYVPVL